MISITHSRIYIWMRAMPRVTNIQVLGWTTNNLFEKYTVLFKNEPESCTSSFILVLYQEKKNIDVKCILFS